MRRFLLIILLVLLLLAVGWGAWRVYAGGTGSRTAVCPGPDFFGYTCDTNGNIPYQEAQFDTFLYEDDGYIALELPFPFTFYGQTYTVMQAHVNGVLRMGDDNDQPLADNICLPDSSGDLIAPYWDDLDLVFEGYLRGELIGEAPNRVIILEWAGVPLANNPDDTVSFAVHLFEGSNDILFLYDQVATQTNPNGGSATIGIASSRIDSSLTVGCNDTAVSNGDQVRFIYPDDPAVQAPRLPVSMQGMAQPTAQSDLTMLHTAVQPSNALTLDRLQRQWLQQNPPRRLSWQLADVTGDKQEELLVLIQGAPGYPHLTQIVVLDSSRQTVLWRTPLHGRGITETGWTLQHGRDYNGDGLLDIILQNEAGDWAIFHWNQTEFTQLR